MPASSLNTLIQVLESSIDDICKLRDERRVQDIIAARARAVGLPIETRAVLRSNQYPDIEVDLSESEGKLAVEVKLDSRFYSGIGQAIALRELYDREAVVLHIMKYVDEMTERALRKVCAAAGLKIILIDRTERRIKVVP